MPAPAAMSPPQSRTPQGANTRQQVPFVRATKKHSEPFFDQTNNPSTTLSPINIPAYGFLRGVWMQVNAVGSVGTTTNATYTTDTPWTVISFIGLFDVNGAPLYGPFASGYNSYLIGKYGGYHGRGYDPKSGDYTAPTSGLFNFWLYIPVEIVKRNALGSLANLNAAATYKLQITLNSIANTYTVIPGPTPPTGFRIRLWLDAWTQPPASDLLGNMTQQAPFAHGTTQFWSEQVYTISSGQQTVRLLRVGLYIRNLIFKLSTSANARVDTDWADPVQLFLDGFELTNLSQHRLWQEEYALFGISPITADTAGNRDTNVYPFPFNDDFNQTPGEELRNRYLPTLQSSRLELRGSFGSNASQLSVMTNDIAPAGDIFMAPADNYTE